MRVIEKFAPCPACGTPLHLRDAERHLVARALALTAGNKTKASYLLGVNVRTLRRWMKGGRKSPRDPAQLTLV